MRDVGREDHETRILHLILHPVSRITHLLSRIAVPGSMKRLLRERLVHFLLIGAVLFAVDHYVQPARGAAPSSKQIQLSLEELAQLAVIFQSQWRREPTPEEFNRLVENRVQEEILYREALAMGLDKDDTIVKRRMAQKLQFLSEDTAAAREPKTAELKSWYGQNSAKFAEPNRVSFRHIYFSPDRRGNRAQDDAAKALGQLASEPRDAKLAASSADPFMFQDYYRERAPDQLAKEFGPRFALAVAKLAPGAWQGPIESGYGWHLVFVDTVIPGRVPDFEEIEPDVKTAWLGEQKSQAWEKAYKEMRAKYTVLLPAPPDKESARAPTPAARKEIPTLPQ
jgi:parvulin-like peptidyl-prolyl isomerase